ncbi:hypothetical protein BDP27DRAFT_332970 [Rhodocollybia butyracea]|uniref:2'-phosphotransferase n=1 Tax=Rhodocollybia butyracea TaxID=206335 RepID=A0A9P5QBF3_9AGAR|nr:hypothetical protein BDP27DRAFT_332970 [Rhodocollybia butyracea]
MLFATLVNGRPYLHPLLLQRRLIATVETISPIRKKAYRLGHKPFKHWFENNHPKSIKYGPRLTWMLRHGAPGHNLYMRPDGFVLIEDLLKLEPLKHLYITDLRKIVGFDPIQRLQLKKLRPQRWFIRALKNHTISVRILIFHLCQLLHRRN